MGTNSSECRAGDDDLVLLTRASLADGPYISPANRGKIDALISVDSYRVSPTADVIEYLLVRTGPEGRPTELQFVESGCPGYYEIGTTRLFINRPVRRSDLALYRVGDLRSIGLLI